MLREPHDLPDVLCNVCERAVEGSDHWHRLGANMDGGEKVFRAQRGQ